jgi:collagenase-like PrtC family protease
MNKALFNTIPIGATPALASSVELVCPVDTLVQLRAAVDNGADYIQLRFAARIGQDNHVNSKAMASGIRYARDRRCKVVVQLQEAARDVTTWAVLRKLIDEAAAHGADALELSDHALILYAAAHYPQLKLHYSANNIIDARAVEAVKRQFNVSRLTLPRLISTAELIRLSQETGMELQLHGFSCFSSGAKADVLLGAAADMRMDGKKTKQPDHDCGSEQCATAEQAANDDSFSERKTADIQVLKLLPELTAIGIHAILVETQGPRPNEIAHITRIWREAIDECLENTDRYTVRPSWIAGLNNAAMQLQSR